MVDSSQKFYFVVFLGKTALFLPWTSWKFLLHSSTVVLFYLDSPLNLPRAYFQGNQGLFQMNYPFRVKIIKGDSFIGLDGLPVTVHTAFLFQLPLLSFYCGDENNVVGGVVGLWWPQQLPVLGSYCVPARVLGALYVFLFNLHRNPIYTC